jgi:16S rRNA (guanine527-N7)-methyltransferase
MSAADALADGLSALGLELDARACERLLNYVALLEKWNDVYNLTAVRGARNIVIHHLLDSLSVLPYVAGDTMLDVGSGAGLPGIPLAVVRPQTQVTLLDAREKKTAFLRQAVIELGLRNAEVVCGRIERYFPSARFAVVISRAFSDLRKFVELAGRLCAPNGVLAVMKGRYAPAELARLPSAFALEKALPIAVPGLCAERHLILLQPASRDP